MIVSLAKAQEIKDTITQSDILSIEKAIIAESNNNFRVKNFKATITEIDRDGTVYFEGADVFQAGDTVEVRHVPLIDGIFHVKSTGVGYIELELNKPLRISEGNLTGSLFIVEFPQDVADGAMQILKHRAFDSGSPRGELRSKSVGRVREEYVTHDGQQTIHGAPTMMWGFLEPYRRLGWS